MSYLGFLGSDVHVVAKEDLGILGGGTTSEKIIIIVIVIVNIHYTHSKE